MSGGKIELLNPECLLILPRYRATGTVEQTPLGRVYVAAQPADPALPTKPVPQPSQATIRWAVRGTSALRAEDALRELAALLDGATRLYQGDCWLTVVRLAEASDPEAGFAGLSHKGTHVYDLFSPEFEDAAGRRGRMPW